MKITSIHLSGYRNFLDARINLVKKTLIIGANDVGKTNLLYAIRLLLDKTLSEADLEPKDSDFYAYKEGINDLSITVWLDELGANVRTQFKGSVSEEGIVVLKYSASRDAATGKKEYTLKVGPSDEEVALTELPSRTYLRTLNIRYVDSNRNLLAFIKREKKSLLQEAKDGRTPEEITADEVLQGNVKTSLNQINEDIEAMSYVAKATVGINKELSKLSVHHEAQDVVFEVGANDPSVFVDGAHLASRVAGQRLDIGGDGRNNQIFLSLWAAKNRLEEGQEEVESIICAIEEPEAHLHPHQQRKLASYLSTNLDAQVILTSHSPEIAGKFAPGSIVRLTSKAMQTSAASLGCTPVVADSFVDFGHRLDAIAAEAFFADVIFLVEGQSEVLFYKALARQIGVDLDRYNISILMVDGVGFNTYIDLLKVLEIDFVIRTDNDVFKVPRSEPVKYRLAGIQRGLGFFLRMNEIDPDKPVATPVPPAAAATRPAAPAEPMVEFIDRREELTGHPENQLAAMSEDTKELAERYRTFLAGERVFIAKEDLEKDLLASPAGAAINDYLVEGEGKDDVDSLKIMQKRKATFMYNFLQGSEAALAQLAEDEIAAPLRLCLKIAEERRLIEEDETDG